MKLKHLHEQLNPFGEFVKARMKKRIMKGDSRLKKILSKTGSNLDQVRYAIKKSICFHNLGPTYLEQTISNVLRDMVREHELPAIQINDARMYFHLEKLSPRKKKKQTF